MSISEELRSRALRAIAALSLQLDNKESAEAEVIAVYLDSKRTLAGVFQEVAVGIRPDTQIWSSFVLRLEGTMAAQFPHLPPKYRKITGFGLVHQYLFTYLARRQGDEVAVDELRLLTKDAVHTERRVRELRDLGIEVPVVEHSGSRWFRISIPDDLTAAAEHWLRRRLSKEASLSEAEREDFLNSLG